MAIETLHPKRGILPIAWNVIQVETQEWWLEMLTTLAIPLTYILAFGFGLRGYIEQVDGVPYIVFLAPGLIGLTILMEAYKMGGWGLWLDRWHQGMVDEYRIKPISSADIIIGKILGGIAIALAKGSITALVLLTITPVTLNPLNILPFLAYMLPGCVLFTSLGSFVGVTFRKPDHIANSQVVVITPLLYLGGLFFPLSSLPEHLIPILKWFPTTALFDGGRNALLHGTIEPQYLYTLLLSALAAFFFATLWFKRKLSE